MKKEEDLFLLQYEQDELNRVKNLLHEIDCFVHEKDRYFSTAAIDAESKFHAFGKPLASVNYLKLEFILLRKAEKRFAIVFRHFPWMHDLKKIISVFDRNAKILDGTDIRTRIEELISKIDLKEYVI